MIFNAIRAAVKHADFAESFAPVARPDAKVLILGSMPGRESLKAAQYYAHPRNHFWKIMAALLHFPQDAPYAERLAVLQASGVALWDAMRSCQRVGSLDASIQAGTVEANDFAVFFASHPQIQAVFFNGATAHTTYARHVLPSVQGLGLYYSRLPSTSPAHATLSFAQKFEAWKVVVAPVR